MDDKKHTAVYWKDLLSEYKKASNKKAGIQLILSGALFILSWLCALYAYKFGYVFAPVFCVFIALFVMRLFIIQHDCGHKAFFTSQKVNNVVGFVLGIITFTPYQYWRRTHAIHHKHSGNLNGRTFGEIKTLTVKEYINKNAWQKFCYNVYRNVFVLLFIGSVWQFIIKHRFPYDAPMKWKKEWISVICSDLALTALIILATLTIGIKFFLLIQLPTTIIAGVVGIWLFYVQHQFQDTYWQLKTEWDYYNAAMRGSSFYDLPKWMHWVTANIGYHHIHHLSSRIPNYNLQKCYEDIPELQQVNGLGFIESFKCASLRLWDENQKRLISFKQFRNLQLNK